MKKSVKFLMVALLAMGSTTLFAQKFGRIDYQNVLFTMPEIATVRTDLQKVESDLMEILEGMQVEVNKKMDEISKLPDTTSETTRQMKNREAVDLQQRLQEYYQVAQQDVEKAQADLMKPLQDKIDAAIKKTCKAQNIIAVFQQGAMVYLDEQQVVDITPTVKTELGIPADAVPAMPAQ